MNKKILSLCITMIMLLGACMIVPAEETGQKFIDIPDDSDYTQYVYDMADKGIIKGYSPEYFFPDDNCTRAQFITFLYRAASMPEAKKESSFTDVVKGEYYEDAISWAEEAGIASGFEDNTFGVDLPVDRCHAVKFLYEWTKATGRTNAPQKIYLSDYADAKELETYAYLGFAWAVDEGIIEIGEDNKLYPKATVTRAWVASALGKVLNTHYHEWEKITDNGDGTHTCICRDDETHTQTENHDFNSGELIKKATQTENGEILYTCKDCFFTKTEVVPKGTEVTTREDMEKAILATAWAYYAKDKKVQYDSTVLTSLSSSLGGLQRLSVHAAPEFATEQQPLYSVCSTYVNIAYFDALNITAMGDVNLPAGFSTAYLLRYGDNQLKGTTGKSKYNDPIDEDDVDACLMRFINLDKYYEIYPDRPSGDVAARMFESDSFTDYTEGLEFKEDGLDGKVHYSYYDSEGNKLVYEDVWDKYVTPYFENYEENLRPGDVLVTHTHALLYIGDGRFLDCNGSKINTKTGEDMIEEKGGITYDFDIQNLIKDHVICNYSIVHDRPLDFLIDKGFDDDLGNDVAKDFKIPQKSKSREEYPLMDIDRTVDITHFGTVAKGDALTYTVKIRNRTNSENYKHWIGLSNPDGVAEESYKDLVVTETVPNGTELIEDSVSEGGKYSDGVIKWNLEEVKAGEEIVLTYKVKAIGEVGTKIVNDGGMVANIPSNSITNIIGGAKLTNSEKTALSNVSTSGADGMSKYGEDTDFAEAIYSKMGKTLTLPSASDIVAGLFPVKAHIPGSSEPGGGMTSPNYTPINMFCMQNSVAEEYSAVKSMLINKYWGGRRFFVGEDDKWNTATNAIHDFKTEFLEPGDIIVYMTAKDRENTTMANEFAMVKVMVYDGGKLLSATKTEEGAKYEVFESDAVLAQLLKALTKDNDIFFALRPSQYTEEN